MSKAIKKVEISKDHMKRVSKANPAQAIEELIWNSLDADANNVSVRIHNNTMGNTSITVEDDGVGLTLLRAEGHLVYIGNSWKRNKTETDKGRPIHGNKGEGRFKSFTLGRVVEWESVYEKAGKLHKLAIIFNADRPGEFEILPSKTNANAKETKMSITISELEDKIITHKFGNLKERLIKTFASHLYTYPDITLMLNGHPIDPQEAIENVVEYELDVEGLKGSHKLKIIEWKEIISKQVLLCKNNGTVLREHILQPYRVRSGNYSFSAYLMSDYISQLNSEDSLDLLEVHPNGKDLIEATYTKLNEHFKNKKQQESLQRLERWKQEGIYPFEEKDQDKVGAIESVNRDIFDMIATKVEDNLPKFEKTDVATKKFTFQLLSQSIQGSPKSVQKIITEVLNLNQKEQDDFAELLNKTSLTAVIRSAQIVADRLDFLDGLETLVFDYKKSLLERDQLHKVLENEAWIFDEHFGFSGSEKRLEDVLKIHLKLLGKRIDDDSNVLINEKKQGRVDLMLSKTVEVRPGHKDFLVVELKRPSQKINHDVIGQILGYAQAVSNDTRFDKSKCNWKFIAVSNDFDKKAQMQADEPSKPQGCIYSSDNIEIYIMKWSEVITNAKARLKFYQEQLQYEATDETSLAYLQKVHNTFIPTDIQS